MSHSNLDYTEEIAAVVGLGNPGEKYTRTKHNIGFRVIDNLFAEMKGKVTRVSGCRGECCTKKISGRKIYFLKPQTYMNLSGVSVAGLCKKAKLLPSQMLIVYDDMDLPFGKIRIRKSGGSAGHNGIESIIGELNTTEFPRLRIGIGRVDSPEMVSHVLAEFSNEDEEILPKLLELSCSAIKLSLRRGITTAMNEYNSYDILSKTSNKG